MKIYAYGDSFVAGDQDIPGRINAIHENMEYNRYNVSFASVLAKQLNSELVNRAISGCSNFVQLDKLFMDCEIIEPHDLVIFGFSSPWRDRWSIPTYGPDFLKDNKGPALVDRDLIKSETHRVGIVDFFYVLSVLEQLQRTYKFKIIAFNSFHNVLKDASIQDLKKFNFDNFIGLKENGNTLLNVLSDTWGQDDGSDDHTVWSAPKGLENLFTSKRHPSIEGHKKIAKWLYEYI
jgi:hypothetical protein